ncbi:molecular chaperone DnaK, partial [Candidatus Sumerlaeota bacterium]|nr:molecular chaperone DnaK [Candidatus Sumerlaeota bacterium]
IEREIEKLKKAIEGDSIDEIRKCIDSLNTASHKLSEVLYQKVKGTAGATAGSSAGSSSSAAGESSSGQRSSEGDVVDAEYEVEDDKKS